MVVHRAEPSQRLGQNRWLGIAFGGGNRRVIALDCLGNAAGSLVSLGVL
jgi:hypothetical protein